MAAGDAVVKGTNDFTEQPYRKRWLRGRGWRKVRIFEGPLDDTKINTVVTTLQAANCEEIDVQRGWPTVIEATVPSDSNSIGVGLSNPDDQTEWSLEPYDLHKALASHGQFNKFTGSAEVLALIDADVKSGQAYGKDYDTAYPTLGELNKYALLRQMGVETYLSHGFILRATLVCERLNTYVKTFQDNINNAGKIIKWDAIGVPQAAQINRPKVHIYTAYEMGVLSPKWDDLFIDEWYVKPASVRFTQQGRVRMRQLVREWVGAWKWSTVLYHGGTGTP